jgi:acetate kinase
VTPPVLEQLRSVSDLAPLHNPPAIAALRTLLEGSGNPVIACFDTAFHATLPPAAATYAIPAQWRSSWPLRRFGFHGLSHAYAARRAAQLMDREADADLRLVTCHLGAGASLAAVVGGCSVDTTMGFTPLDGLVMATRPGVLDPGLVLWLCKNSDMTPTEIERALERDSGLTGLAGLSDMREILARAAHNDEGCVLAREVYVHRLCGLVAAMVASMEGVDGIVFTGGVGEGAAEVRQRACARLRHLGVAVDTDANDSWDGHDGSVSLADASVQVMVVAAREDLEIAREVRAVLD